MSPEADRQEENPLVGAKEFEKYQELVKQRENEQETKVPPVDPQGEGGPLASKSAESAMAELNRLKEERRIEQNRFIPQEPEQDSSAQEHDQESQAA
jgi:hypothetical protein